MTKYTKNVQWLEDYVNSIYDLVPIEQIKRVVGYKVKLGLKENQEALIRVANSRGTKFIISIKLYEQGLVKGKLRHIPLTYSYILDGLAHECAHLIHFQDHDAAHLKLQAQILKRFAAVMKKKNVQDSSKAFLDVIKHNEKV